MIEVFNGSQVGIQLIDNAVDFQIGKPRVYFIGRIDTERKWNTLAPVELLEPLVNIVCIPDLHIFREGWVGQYVDHACFVHSFNPLLFLPASHLKQDSLDSLPTCAFLPVTPNTYNIAWVR